MTTATIRLELQLHDMETAAEAADLFMQLVRDPFVQPWYIEVDMSDGFTTVEWPLNDDKGDR